MLSIACITSVALVLILFMLWYRRKRVEARQRTTGRNLGWFFAAAVAAGVILVVVGAVIVRRRTARNANALHVTVIAHQFWWEYRYPKFGIITANELHIPGGDGQHSAATLLTLTSADTSHRFCVPGLTTPTEVRPNRVETISVVAPRPGLYAGACGADSETRRSTMLVRVYADTPEEFAGWLAHQRQPAHADVNTEQGRDVFLHNACASCHSISGTAATGRFGPDLTHMASRDTIASGALPRTMANVRAFIQDPAGVKPGALMPPMQLRPADLNAVPQYLMSLN